MNHGKPRGYYRYATFGDLGALLNCGLGLLGAVCTLSESRLNAVSAKIEAVHARIARRRDEAAGRPA